MNKEFEEIIRKLSPTLRRITHKLNGHFTFFDDDDLFQEALEHLWLLFQDGKLKDNTDSYVLQGCFYHLKNYLRKTLDKSKLMSLNKIIDEDDTTLDDFLAYEGASAIQEIDYSLLVEAAKENGLSKRELQVLSLSLEGLTLREIGHRLDISHVMVMKVKDKIKKKCAALKNDLKEGYQN